ncbi:MAG: hypothetical protein RIB47_11470 [Cyclobacteriaceae bacterium]
MRKRIDKNLVIIVSLATLQFVLSSIIGLVNEAPVSNVLNDVKPLLFIFSGIVFYSLIDSSKTIKLVTKLLKVSSLILAITYLAVFAGINLGIIPFLPFYNMVQPTEEFFFRGEFAFFYKGFMYLCVGAIFYFWQFKESSKLTIFLICAAIVLTFTRGFIVSSASVFVVYFIFIKPKYVRSIVGLGILVLGLFFGWSYVSNSSNIDRGVSDSDRIVQIKEVAERFTIPSAVFGHGFGIGVPFRPEHMEISYLEIFHKQGLLGLLFWLIIFVYGTYLFKVTKHKGHSDSAMPFYLSMLFVYIQSFTNPFINNPIGLSMIMISLAVLRFLAQQERDTAISA